MAGWPTDTGDLQVASCFLQSHFFYTSYSAWYLHLSDNFCTSSQEPLVITDWLCFQIFWRKCSVLKRQNIWYFCLDPCTPRTLLAFPSFNNHTSNLEKSCFFLSCCVKNHRDNRKTEQMQNNWIACTQCTGQICTGPDLKLITSSGMSPTEANGIWTRPKGGTPKSRGSFLSHLSVTVIIGVVCNSSR